MEKTATKIKIENENDLPDRHFVEYRTVNVTATEVNHMVQPDADDGKKKMLDELAGLKQQVNHHYFESRKKDELIEMMKDTAIRTKEEMTAQIDGLSNEIVAYRDEIAKLQDFGRNFETQIDKLKKEKEMLCNMTEKNKSDQKDMLNRIDSLTKQNKLLVAQLEQLKFGIAQSSTEEKGDDTNTFDVERIISHKIRRNKKMFLIRWKNYDKSHDSWVAEKDLNCDKLLMEYLKSIEH